MKSKALLNIFCLAAVGFNLAPAYGATNLETLCSKFPQNSRCEHDSQVIVDPASSQYIAQEYEVIGTNDWRTDEDIPLSEPVIVNDEFDGDYLAVIDKNFSGNLGWLGYESGVVTNWSEHYIRVYAYSIEEICDYDDEILCPQVTTVMEANSLEIKVGNQVFRLAGNNGNFAVPPELAEALHNSPPGNALTRIGFEDSGELIVNEIGAGTTAAWKIVY